MRPKLPKAIVRCPKCNQIQVFDHCVACEPDPEAKKAHDEAIKRKQDWDDRRILAHRQFGTHLKRCRCGHHLVDGECPIANCTCKTDPGCAGKIDTAPQ
jgi:hypothetical protein